MSRAASLCTFLLCMVGFLSIAIPANTQTFRPIVGFHGGINFTQPAIQQSYQIITLLDAAEQPEIIYEPFYRNIGNQVGFSLFLEFNDHLSAGLLPQQTVYSYNYSSQIEFLTTSGIPFSRTETDSRQELTYINIPLIAKYTIRKGTFSPYVLGGIAYGLLRSAQSDIVTTTTQLVYDTREEVTTTNSASQVFITSKLNLLAGFGLEYDLTQVRIGLDVSYWYGLNNVVHEGNRFSNQTISGYTYDIPSDTRLNHYVLNLNVLFPVNKLENRGSLDCVRVKKRR